MWVFSSCKYVFCILRLRDFCNGIITIIGLSVSYANVRINMFDYYFMYVISLIDFSLSFNTVFTNSMLFVLYTMSLDTTLLNVKIKIYKLWSRVLFNTHTYELNMTPGSYSHTSTQCFECATWGHINLWHIKCDNSELVTSITDYTTTYIYSIQIIKAEHLHVV